MVHNVNRDIDRGGQNNQSDNLGEERVQANHSSSHDRIRQLIQGALDPLRVDPVPDHIYIRNILVTRNARGELSISCAVAYETVGPGEGQG